MSTMQGLSYAFIPHLPAPFFSELTKFPYKFHFHKFQKSEIAINSSWCLQSSLHDGAGQSKESMETWRALPVVPSEARSCSERERKKLASTLEYSECNLVHKLPNSRLCSLPAEPSILGNPSSHLPDAGFFQAPQIGLGLEEALTPAADARPPKAKCRLFFAADASQPKLRSREKSRLPSRKYI